MNLCKRHMPKGPMGQYPKALLCANCLGRFSELPAVVVLVPVVTARQPRRRVVYVTRCFG